ncbi:MAG: acetolactate synthase small subunit [Schwartzia sp.]|nr:acetolactate synthase small subunit [Schwartzia sp. (in: firmicutes)]
MKRYCLAVLVDNKPGVLTHVSGLISRRAFNIESISAGYTEDEDITRINIVVSVDSDQELEQVKNQLAKLVDVIKVVNISDTEHLARELVLIKVRATADTRADIVNIVNTFRAKIVDISRSNVVIQLTGNSKKIDAICEVLSDYEIIEIARTGTIALSRGPIPAKHI